MVPAICGYTSIPWSSAGRTISPKLEVPTFSDRSTRGFAFENAAYANNLCGRHYVDIICIGTSTMKLQTPVSHPVSVSRIDAGKFLRQLVGSLVLIVLLSTPTRAAIVYSPVVTVTQFFVMAEYGGGDIGIKVSSPTTGCPHGFWLRPTDGGFKSMYAAAMMAYVTQSSIRVAAHDDSIWTGSTGTYCRVYYVQAE